MRVRTRALLAAITSLSLLAAPSLAAAACPTAQPASTPGFAHVEGEGGVEARAAGDDPVVTPPTDPTCDGAGYDAEFPDIPLESDVISGGGVTQPTGYLPVTGIPGGLLVLLGLFGVTFIGVGARLHVGAMTGRS
jgi:hypothetical protein